jgi:hypothetical protein
MLNKKITSTENFGANKLTISIRDSVGVVSDAWFDGFSVELDTETKQVRCTAAGDLFVGTTDVVSTLNNKATIAQLSDYYTATSIDTKLSKQVNYEYDIDSKLNTISLNKIQALDRLTATGPPLIDIQSDTRIIGTLNVTNDLTVANTNIVNSLADKAPKASPTFTGITTANRIVCTTDLSCGTLTCESISGGVIAQLKTNLFASPTITGTLTCVDAATIGGTLTVSGARLYVAQNITNTQLNGSTSLYFNNTSGASVSEVGRIFCGNSAGLNLCTHTTHPIKFTTYANDASGAPVSMEILGTGNRDVEISAPLKIKCLLTTIEQAVVIGGAAPVEATGLYVSNNAVINRNLTVVGNLTVSGFYPIKPYAALYVVGNAISTSTAVGFLAPSAFTMTRTGGNYGFTFATPHPNGNNFQIFATPRTAGGTTPFFTCTAKVETDTTAGTKFSVWCRNASNAIIDGDFWVHTIP